MTDDVDNLRLKSFVERIEKQEDEKRAVQDDIKDIYTEAKGEGFDVKALRSLIRIRRKSRDELRAEEEMLDLYRSAIGME